MWGRNMDVWTILHVISNMQTQQQKPHSTALLGNVACNFKKIPMLTQDLSRRCIAMREGGGECVYVPS